MISQAINDGRFNGKWYILINGWYLWPGGRLNITCENENGNGYYKTEAKAQEAYDNWNESYEQV